MDLLRRGRTRAEFERFVADHDERLLRTAYLIAWDLAEAEDLVQECLLRVARRWPKVRGMAHPEAYARRVLVNLTFDGARGRKRRRLELSEREKKPLDPLADPRSRGGFAWIDERDELLGALGALPKRQRVVLVLRYFADLSEAQTAQALGCSLGTVKSTSSRALARLREAMAQAPAAEHAQAAGAAQPSLQRPTTTTQGDESND